MVSNWRRGHNRFRRIRQDHGSSEGPDQVGRGVDQLGRPGECVGWTLSDPGGSCHRRATPEMAGAPPCSGGPEREFYRRPLRVALLPATNLRAMASARCIRGCQGASTYLNWKAAEKQTAGGVQPLAMGY